MIMKRKLKSSKLKISIFLFFISYFSLFTFSYARTPERIVSLAPSITEILFSAGVGEKVVGVTTFCDHPDEAKKRPKIGGMSNPSIEAIIRLKPDIVIMTTDGNPREIYERLKDAHIKTHVFKARRLNELTDGIRELGIALDEKERFDALTKRIEEGISHYKRKPLLHGKRVLFIIWPEPLIVAGKDTAISDVINLLGGINLGDSAIGMYPKYSTEEVIRQSPDIIFIGKGHAEMNALSERLLKRISMVPAVRNKSVYHLSDAIYRLGPRIIDGMREIEGYLK